MSYTGILKDTLSALQFEKDGVKQIQSNPDAVTYGIITLILAGVASAIGMLNPIGIIANPIGSLIGAAIGTGITHLFAKLFGGQGSYRDFFAVTTNAQLLLWISVIPIVGPILSGIAGLYLLVFYVFAIKEVYSLSVAKSILVLILPAIIIGVLFILLVTLFAASLFGALGLGSLAAA